MTTDDVPASGLYHHRGWRIEVRQDAASDEVLMASIHEAMHDRLQKTTIYGCLVDLLLDHALATSSQHLERSARGLTRGYTRVHEEFATWMSTAPNAWGPPMLRDTYPLYARHLQRAQRRVDAIPSTYMQIHATQAVARTCMQSAELSELLDDWEGEPIDLGRLDHTMRPDVRLLRLEKALIQHGWGPMLEAGHDCQITPELFAESNDEQWARYNRTAHQWCADLLTDAGFATLPYDGHLPAVHRLGALLASTRSPASDAPDALIALMSVEAETLVLGPAFPATMLPEGTRGSALAAGTSESLHLFLAIRSRESFLAQYSFAEPPPGLPRYVAVVRAYEDDGRVQLLDVTRATASSLLEHGVPVVTSVAMSALADPDVLATWRPLLGAADSTVLCDLRPSINLRAWMQHNPGLRLRFAIVGVETLRLGWVRVLLFRLEDASGGQSRTYVAPVGRLYSTGLELWLTESREVRGRVIRDDSLGDDRATRITLAHILLEEREFSFTWEERQ